MNGFKIYVSTLVTLAMVSTAFAKQSEQSIETQAGKTVNQLGDLRKKINAYLERATPVSKEISGEIEGKIAGSLNGSYNEYSPLSQFILGAALGAIGGGVLGNSAQGIGNIARMGHGASAGLPGVGALMGGAIGGLTNMNNPTAEGHLEGNIDGGLKGTTYKLHDSPVVFWFRVFDDTQIPDLENMKKTAAPLSECVHEYIGKLRQLSQNKMVLTTTEAQKFVSLLLDYRNKIELLQDLKAKAFNDKNLSKRISDQLDSFSKLTEGKKIKLTQIGGLRATPFTVNKKIFAMNDTWLLSGSTANQLCRDELDCFVESTYSKNRYQLNKVYFARPINYSVADLANELRARILDRDSVLNKSAYGYYENSLKQIVEVKTISEVRVGLVQFDKYNQPIANDEPQNLDEIGNPKSDFQCSQKQDLDLLILKSTRFHDFYAEHPIGVDIKTDFPHGN